MIVASNFLPGLVDLPVWFACSQLLLSFYSVQTTTIGAPGVDESCLWFHLRQADATTTLCMCYRTHVLTTQSVVRCALQDESQ